VLQLPAGNYYLMINRPSGRHSLLFIKQ